MAYGGLRGAVGFSLVVLIPALNPKQHQTLNDIFLLTTLIMIFFTVFIQGGHSMTLGIGFKFQSNSSTCT